MRLPFFFAAGLGILALTSPLLSAATAGGLAGPVAGAAENSGKHIGVPVDHVGVVVTPCRDQPDVFGDWSMGRTGPLAIYDFVEVFGCTDIRRFQRILSVRTPPFLISRRPVGW